MENPFIGRIQDLQWFERRLKAWKQRNVVCLGGDGGVGKTRLLREISERYAGAQLYDYRPLRVTLVQELTSSEWSAEFRRGVQTMAAELDIRLEERDAGANLELMAAQLRELIEEERPPDAIVISLGHRANFDELVAQASTRGIRVLTFDNYNEHPGIVTRIEQWNEEGGGRIFQRIAQDLNYRGRVLVMWDAHQQPLWQRVEAAKLAKRQYAELELISDDIPIEQGPIREQAAQRMHARLATGEPIHAVWATWNELAYGVVDALQDAGRTDIPVYMCDLCPSDIELLRSPTSLIRATVGVDIAESGRFALRVAALAVLASEDARSAPLKQRQLLEMRLVTSEELRRASVEEVAELFKQQDRYDLRGQGWSDWLRMRGDAQQGIGTIARIGLVDFDDTNLRISQSVGLDLAEQLGKQLGGAHYFQPYYQVLRELSGREHELSLEPAELRAMQARAGAVFASCLNKLAEQSRIVLLFDTTDALNEEQKREQLPDSELFEYLLGVASELQNCLLVLAGRNGPAIARELLRRPAWRGFTIDSYPLGRLNTAESLALIAERAKALHVPLDQDLAERIVAIAGGRPIMLELAVEWRRRGIALDWLLHKELGELQQLDPKRDRQRFDQFEQELVSHLAAATSDEQWLIMIMSWVYPIDPALAGKLVSVTPERATTILNELSGSLFIKPITIGDRECFQLHDEMRRMIERHVWELIDPRGLRRQRDCRVAVGHYQEQIDQLEGLYKLLGAQEGSEPSVFIQRAALEKAVEVLAIQIISFGLVVSATYPLAFVTAAIDSGQRRDSPFKQRTISTMLDRVAHSGEQIEHLQQLAASNTQIRDFLLRATRVWRDGDRTRKERSVAMLQSLANLPTLSRGELGQILLSLARAQEWLDLDAALDTQQKALKLCAPQQLQAARAYLGYIYRRRGELNQARKTYMLVTRSAKRSAVTDDYIQALTNMGYVMSLQGEQRLGEQYCQLAVDLRRQALQQGGGAGRGDLRLAQAQVALAAILRDKGEYARAVWLLDEALRALDEQDAAAARVRYNAHIGRGWTYWFEAAAAGNDQARLEVAYAELELAQAIVVERALETFQPEVLHQMSHVLWLLGDKSKAREQNREALRKSKDLPDVRYSIDCLLGMAEFDLAEQRYASVLTNERKLVKEHGKLQGEFPLFFGRMGRYCGDVAFERDQDYEQAVEHYGSGLRQIAAHGGYGPYSLEAELSHLGERFSQLPPHLLPTWRARLRHHWGATGSIRLTPPALRLLQEWLDLRS